MNLAVHFVLVGCEKDAPLQWKSVYDCVDHLLQKSGMCCPPAWFGRLLADAVANDCEFDACTIDHSRALIGDNGKSLVGVRISVHSDFMRKKPSRRNPDPPLPACASAYDGLRKHIRTLCADAFDPDHDRSACESVHLQNTWSDAPIRFGARLTAQQLVVKLVLESVVEKARKQNGSMDAKAIVRSQELLDIVEKAVAHAGLAPIVRFKGLPGGEFSRHAIGRCISHSVFWGEAKREEKARGFRGFRLKRPRPDTAQLQVELLREYPGAEQHRPQQQPAPPLLPPIPAANGSTVTLSAEQYAVLARAARQHAERQAADDARRLASLDEHIAALNGQRAAAAEAAKTSAQMLSRL